MPEGPSIVILKEEVQFLKHKKVELATGNSKKIDTSIITGKKVEDFKSWGKHFLICFDDFSIRIHFMLFGSYLVNQQKETTPRLSLKFNNDELNFYACSVKIIDTPLNDVYDWSADIMSEQWDKEKAYYKLKNSQDLLVCDALLDQNIFSGSGNIIKNEVLFLTHIHPLSKVGNLPDEKLKEMIDETRDYSFKFLKWKKAFTLKKHWLAHTKTMCPRDEISLLKKYLGKSKRRTFYCEVCQKLYP